MENTEKIWTVSTFLLNILYKIRNQVNIGLNGERLLTSKHRQSVIMFVNITDPKKREETVHAYLATVKRLQHRDIDERAKDLGRREDLNKKFEPIIASTGQSAKAVTKELLPIQEELKTLNERLQETTEEMKKAVGRVEKKPQQQQQQRQRNVLEQYLHKYGGTNVLDKYFRIQRIATNQYEMGTKDVDIDENSNVIVDGVKYDGTDGLWSLIMLNDPHRGSYTPHDLLMYKGLVYQTNVMSHPHNVVLGRSRYKQTKKWKELLSRLENVGDDDDISDMSEDSLQHDDGGIKSETTIDDHINGSGIQFLPGDIKGLQTKLNYLLAEYRAGNRSSLIRNEIVSILDELLRRKRISRKEYRDVNTFLQ